MEISMKPVDTNANGKEAFIDWKDSGTSDVCVMGVRVICK